MNFSKKSQVSDFFCNEFYETPQSSELLTPEEIGKNKLSEADLNMCSSLATAAQKINNNTVNIENIENIDFQINTDKIKDENPLEEYNEDNSYDSYQDCNDNSKIEDEEFRNIKFSLEKVIYGKIDFFIK